MKSAVPCPNPHLSIAIPTYNRQSELTECLGSIVPQAKPLGVRIYISDNGSRYDVESVIARFRADYELISLHRNDRNLGLDVNLRRVLSMAETDYVWPFSDDDVMVDGALQAIMPLCREGQYDLIIPDREYRDPKLQKTVFSYRVNDVHTPVEYTNPAAFFERYGYSCLTFLGCLIIRASSWTAIDPSKYAGYKWFEHVCIAAEMLCTGKALVLPDCLILVRDNNASWSTQYRMVWGFHFPRALAALPHTYPGRARRKALVDAINPTNNNPARHIMRGRTGRTKSWELPSLVALSLYRFVATQCAILILYLSQIVLMLTRLFHKLRASIGPQQ